MLFFLINTKAKHLNKNFSLLNMERGVILGNR